MKREPTVLQVEISNLRAELKAKDTRIAELEKRDKILCKALEESDKEANDATQKWIAETKILELLS